MLCRKIGVTEEAPNKDGMSDISCFIKVNAKLKKAISKIQQDMTYRLCRRCGESEPHNLIHVHVRSWRRNEGKEGVPKGGVLIPFVVIDVN